ncbi:DUF3333 domain-containing protein, partial [bacterium]|nr:DUF3333 domain-containing protein [bacterium]
MKTKNNPFYDPSLKKRHASAKRFKLYALSSLIIAIGFLVFFMIDMLGKGLPALQQTYIQVEVSYNEKTMNSSRKAIDKRLRKVISRAWLRAIPKQMRENPNLMNTTKLVWALADDQVDQYMKGNYYKLKNKDRNIIDELKEQGRVELQFNSIFFTNGDSKIPEFAGIKSALIGSILTLLVTMIASFPIGVRTAIYLEEFAQDNRFTQMIEVNINNLAAIPSILFGLLGLSIYINLFGMPRSSTLVGGLTLGLMTLPIIIVTEMA